MYIYFFKFLIEKKNIKKKINKIKFVKKIKNKNESFIRF